MPTVSTGSTSIPFNSVLRIGYRTAGSLAGFTYLPTTPDSTMLPFSFTLGTGPWEIEYTVICNMCSGDAFADPQICEIIVV